MLVVQKSSQYFSRFILKTGQLGVTVRWCHQENQFPLYHKHRLSKKVAIEDELGSHSYSQLYTQAQHLAEKIKSNLREPGQSVAFMSENNKNYLVAQWAVWMSGGVAVPLCSSHPTSSIRYYLEDSKADLTLVTETLAPKLQTLQSQFQIMEYSTSNHQDSEINEDFGERRIDGENGAMILYTSGTTGPPKGVVLTHNNIKSQTECLLSAWEYSHTDRLLHVLPLHHTHGIVNCLLCPLATGATVRMLPAFSAEKVWSAIINKEVNLFMAVPTIYAKLIEHFNKAQLDQDMVREACKHIRLMVSGSAALPTPILHRWKEITGHTLLERYGMTEIGMALTNPLRGVRTPGAVGQPFPGVQARIIRAGTNEILAEGDSTQLSTNQSEEGDLQIRGPNVFKEYLNKPEATAKEFDGDWFKTGDTSKIEDGVFRILGRSSVDIIKSGGYKISALDIERILLTHPLIQDICVVGVSDPVWGQKIAGVAVLNTQESSLTLQELRSWCEDKMPKYWLPSDLRILNEMPRNAMGKVNKKELIKTIFS